MAKVRTVAAAVKAAVAGRTGVVAGMTLVAGATVAVAAVACRAVPGAGGRGASASAR